MINPSPFVSCPQYLGMPIFISPLLGSRTVPIREYKRRSWVTEARADRMQKKWVKRYGVELREDIIATPQGFFVSAATFKKLRSALT